MSDFYDRHFGKGDVRTRAMLRDIQHKTQRGQPLSKEEFALVTQGVGSALETGEMKWLAPRGKGRPAHERTDFKHVAAWYALNCDPYLMSLPRAENRDPDEAAKVLGFCGGSNLKKLAAKFEAGRDPCDDMLVWEHGAEYLKRRRIQPSDENILAMEDSFKLAARQLREKSK